MIFKVLDYNNVPVILSKNTWFNKLLDPIFGHPEIKPFKHLIKKKIELPDFVYQSAHDPRSCLFYSKITAGIYSSYFLVIVIKYVKEHNINIGYVSTIMINRKLPKISLLIWERKILT